MARADYQYYVRTISGRNCLIIEDLNLGSMSVTNDIENVVEEICQKEKINPVEFMIVYKDSEGTWDGYNFSTFQFIHLNQSNYIEAVKAYIKKQLE